MLARRIICHGPSTENPPRWTIASTPLVMRSMSDIFATSPRVDFSPAASALIDRMSDKRRWYFPASSQRRCVPTSPAAPVIRIVFIGSPTYPVSVEASPGAPQHTRRNTSANALLDQRNQCLDGFWRNHVGTGIDGEAGKPVLLRQHALHHRQEALQVELLIERNGDPAFLQAVDGRGRKIDPADDDVARLLARRLQRLGDYRRNAAVLRADPLHARILGKIGRQHPYRQRAV